MNKENVKRAFQEYKNGNSEAFNKIYSECSVFVKNITFSMLKNREDSEDTCQNIFLKMYLIKKEKLPDKNEVGWIYTVSKNACKDLIKNRQSFEDINEIYNDNIEVESDEIENNEIRQLYNQTFKKLSQNEQKIVFLRLWNNLTFKDISSLLNKSISTISATYYNAIDKVKAGINLDNL